MGSSNHHHHHHPGSGSLAGNPHGSSHPSTPTSSNPLVPAADPDPSNCQPSHLLPSEDCLLPSTPISSHHQAFVSSPSISLSLSSLSSTKPIHHSGANSGSTSSSTCSSTCSSPPSYKYSTLPPFYPQAAGYRWSTTPFRQIRCHPLHFLKSRLSPLLFLTLIFAIGYLLGSHSRSHPQSIPASQQLARFVLRQPRIPFLVNLASSPPSPAPPAQDHSLQVGRSKDKIPSIVHYVFGMAPDFGGKVVLNLISTPFGFIHYASIQSAVQILRPKEIHFHYHYEPTGWWFERAQEIDGFKLVKERDVSEIYGRPVKHFAHKADIIRLEALRDYGGIYLDLDVFVVRNFDSLLNLEVVLGQEARPRPTFSRRPGSESVDEPVGLCNAIILAKPFAPFITRWLSSYRSFNHHRWADHSSVIPWALAQAHPDELTVLGPRAFFYPLWHEDDLWLVHKTTDWDFDRSEQFAYHAWSSISHANYLQSLDPDRIHASGGPERGESSFTYFVRRFIHDSIREEWREAKANRSLTF
ncbi:uncharacterized protein PGTG_06625 [Puccinia graminis f. sp. tritici CRL 75-36-700-3]|uniref:Uncharacterized protein n=1 Tax=Puccinia graminis f. sp. tritici (strain CRL 75-36-700-3 / race SCCL) TaxID=418459 RepID=E3K908_PUCGT|nr:uncharacterized protein PGTG_06625 [Puccinia graminis f. sp. tritici CRL 75-36-700-3]EFP80669.2 hypothetical protein PGTG_06625 [Puccinia graminis f. sp. tritici CRL 75-36-700-3]